MPVRLLLPAFKLLTSVQEVPSYFSVSAVIPGGATPPNARPAVLDPEPARSFIIVFFVCAPQYLC